MPQCISTVLYSEVLELITLCSDDTNSVYITVIKTQVNRCHNDCIIFRVLHIYSPKYCIIIIVINCNTRSAVVRLQVVQSYNSTTVLVFRSMVRGPLQEEPKAAYLAVVV